ncbi:MAG: molybdenum ABC transporter ATP-binding protein [Candidatus Acidiferrum sp.]
MSILSVKIDKRFRSESAGEFQLQFDQQISPGITILFGPSGGGKSTLLDCIAGLQTPDAGRVALGDQIFFDSDRNIICPPQRRRIAYVFQSLALFPHLTVEQNVAYGLFEMNSLDRSDRIERVLEAFHIAPLKYRKPRELSGGEKQRVALARSLATDPQLLLLDEPLTGLDARLRSAILQDLRELEAARQIPILYVTHNREELDAIGDRVIALAGGKVTGVGSARQVLDAPKSAVIAQVAGFENLLDASVTEVELADGIMRVGLSPSACELEIPLSGAKKGDRVQIAIRAGDILIATEQPRYLSARNVLPGRIESLEFQGTVVAVKVHSGVRFVVHVTPGAVRSLGLTAGIPVWLVLKTHSCHIVS